MQQWRCIEPTEIMKAGHRIVVRKTFLRPDGQEDVFDTKDREGAAGVCVVAITTDDKVVTYQLYRIGPEAFMNELPGGSAEEHEGNLEAVARRELLEETGYVPGKMTYLGKLSYDAWTNGWRHAFLAEACQKVAKSEQHTDDPLDAFGRVVLISKDQLIANALAGRMTDSGAVMLACAHMGWSLRGEKTT